ncbi:MAG: 50S ribosomal protein L10 [Solirubrobacterales bacterium]
MDRAQKEQVVEEIAAELGEADAIFAIDYRGISVPQAAELRGKLREADASFNVVKNRLAKLAAAQAGRDGLDEMLVGPTALTYVRGDVVTAAKAIATFNREHDVLTYKGGFMDGDALDEERFTSLSRLPALEVMHGQLVGMTAAPLTGLVRGLGSMISGLAIALGQIAEQGLVTGEAPAAAEEEAPAAEEEAPTAEEEAPAEEPAAEEEAPAKTETESNDSAEESEAEVADESAETETEEDN